MKSDKTVDLVVYGREACHLCNQMILALEERQKQVPFDFQVIDIDTDSDLVARFNDRIPVLMSYSDQIEICHFHFDNAAFDDYLARFR